MHVIDMAIAGPKRLCLLHHHQSAGKLSTVETQQGKAYERTRVGWGVKSATVVATTDCRPVRLFKVPAQSIHADRTHTFLSQLAGLAALGGVLEALADIVRGVLLYRLAGAGPGLGSGGGADGLRSRRGDGDA